MQPEDVFKHHFGFGFDQMFQSWREWVQQQGIGTIASPPPLTRDKLLHQVIPLVANRQSTREDRILAIRQMGSDGYVIGADVLISLLHDVDDAIPSEEVIWALEAISGMAHGDDKERWLAWWNSLPIEIREECHLIGGKTPYTRTRPPG